MTHTVYLGLSAFNGWSDDLVAVIHLCTQTCNIMYTVQITGHVPFYASWLYFCYESIVWYVTFPGCILSRIKAILYFPLTLNKIFTVSFFTMLHWYLGIHVS